MKFMKHFDKIIFALLTAAFITQVYGDIPRKAPLTRYTGLWSNSPFTSKPPPATGPTAVNPLEDFTLTGIAPVPGGYRITIVNKKNPDEKKVIEPGGSDDFQLVSVDRNPEVSLGTTVVLSAGGTQGTVTFEPDLITLKKAPAAAPVQTARKLPPGVTAAQANQKKRQRQPRPRIVTPPTPAKAPQSSNNGKSQERRRVK